MIINNYLAISYIDNTSGGRRLLLGGLSLNVYSEVNMHNSMLFARNRLAST